MAIKKGTGRPVQKETAAPQPPVQEQGMGAAGARAQKAAPRSSDDLKAREYRDAHGNIHHHTRGKMAQK